MSFDSRNTPFITGIRSQGLDVTTILVSSASGAIPDEATGAWLIGQRSIAGSLVARDFMFTLEGVAGRPAAECMRTDRLLLTNREQLMAIAVARVPGGSIFELVKIQFFTGRVGLTA